MKLTKQLIKRFENPEITVRVMNGYFKCAEAIVKYSNGWEYKVRVEHTPERLKKYGDFDDKVFVYPTSVNSGTAHKIPDELQFVEENLQNLVKYTEEEIDKIDQDMQNALKDFWKEFKGD